MAVLNGVVFALGIPKQWAPNDGTDTTVLPLEDVPGLAFQDDEAQQFLDEIGATLLNGGYQNIDPPGEQRSDDWHWDDDGCAEDASVAIEMATPSAPVGDDKKIEDDSFFDQVWDYDDPFIDLSESTGPVQAQAPPDQFGEDWFEGAEFSPDAEQFDESAQVVANAATASDLPAQDEWLWDEDPGQTLVNGGYQNVDAPGEQRGEDWFEEPFAEDIDADSAPVVANATTIDVVAAEDWQDESVADDVADDSAPVGADAPVLAGLAPSDDWPWEEEPSPLLVNGGYQNTDAPVAVAPAEDWPESAPDDDIDADSAPVIADAAVATSQPPQDEDWLFDDVPAPSLGSDSYQQSDADPQLPDEDWHDPVTIEDWVDESGPVVPDAVIAPAGLVEDAFDFSDPQPEEWVEDSAPVGPDFVAAAIPEDAWPLEAEFVEEFFDDSGPVVADAIAQVAFPLDEDFGDTDAPESIDSDSAPVGPDNSDQGLGDETWLDDAFGEDALDESAPVVPDAGVDAGVSEDWFDDAANEDIDGDSAPVIANAPVLPPLIVDDAVDWSDPQPEEWVEDSAPVGPNAPQNHEVCSEDSYQWFDDFDGEWVDDTAPAPEAEVIVPNPCRILVVPGEDRVFIVKGEDRTQHEH